MFQRNDERFHTRARTCFYVHIRPPLVARAQAAANAYFRIVKGRDTTPEEVAQILFNQDKYTPGQNIHGNRYYAGARLPSPAITPASIPALTLLCDVPGAQV